MCRVNMLETKSGGCNVPGKQVTITKVEDVLCQVKRFRNQKRRMYSKVLGKYVPVTKFTLE